MLRYMLKPVPACHVALDFVDEVFLEFLRDADFEDFLRDDVAFGQRLALADVVAGVHDDVLVERDEGSSTSLVTGSRTRTCGCPPPCFKHPGFGQSGSSSGKRQFSNDWKKVFQWLEKMGRFFQ